MAYEILQAGSKQKLEELVMEQIRKGWQPMGGVCIAEGIFYQAMIGS
jgi:hypothetical protein